MIFSIGIHYFLFVETQNGICLSSIAFLRKLIEAAINHKQYAHGPCLSDKDELLDIAFCFHLYSWPRQAEKWIYRHRSGQWPTDILIKEIVDYGCLLVPIGPKEIENSEFLWRISFSRTQCLTNIFHFVFQQGIQVR
jgi:hypothetical protein